MLTISSFRLPFSHVVLLNSDGTALSGQGEYFGERPNHQDNATALPIVVDQKQHNNVELLKKEIEFPDRIIRLERSEDVEPDKIHQLVDDQRRVDFVVSLTSHFKGPILEIGCSQGIISMRLARKTYYRVLGVDVREEALREARDLLDNEYQDVKDLCRFMLIDKLPQHTKPEKFRTVLLLEVLEHLSTKSQHLVMQQVVNNLNSSNGVCLFSVPNRWPHPKYEKQNRTRWKWPGHVSFFSLQNFKDLILQYFEDVEVLTFPDEQCPEDGLWLHLLAKNKRRQ